MDIHQAALRLNGNEYRREGSHELWAEMKAAGFVAIFGASDDLMEFRGAVDDEIGAGNGSIAHFDNDGLMVSDCGMDEECQYFKKALAKAATVEAVWCGELAEYGWSYKTDTPHTNFNITEDGDPYCRGIVIDLANLGDVRTS